ncbi:MAG: hypothetical protein ABWY58_00840 [Aeromicrobium sp.]
MVLRSVRVRPPNSLIFVMDERVGVIPGDSSMTPVAVTSSCVTVPTLTELDGETEILLSDPESFSPTPDLAMVWSGTLRTAGVLQVSTSDAEALLTLELLANETPVVSVWANDRNEPDVIWIVVDQTPDRDRPARGWWICNRLKPREVADPPRGAWGTR